MTDNILYNKKGQPFIINRTFVKNKQTYCEIKFLEIGSIREVRKSVIDEKTVKDRFAKDVCGVACIGNVTKMDNIKEYSVWKNMIDRCYNPNNTHYNRYGNNGVTVCDRWLCFEYFLQDLPSVKGYDEEKFYSGELQLDKDKKQLGLKNKIYSLETCSFLTREENYSLRETPEIIMKKTKWKCIAKYRDGTEIYVDHVPTFAKENNLQACKIYLCLNGKRPQHKGWVFEEWK